MKIVIGIYRTRGNAQLFKKSKYFVVGNRNTANNSSGQSKKRGGRNADENDRIDRFS